jgi:NAD dependent epimerase/dehydratase
MKEFWKSKNVFITGAGGFIGSHLTEKLLVLGANVTALVQYNSRNDWGMLENSDYKRNPKLKIVLGDIRDAFMMKKLTEGQEFVFHLAALIGIPYSYLAPNSYIDTNIQGSANLFQACLENNVRKIIHTSTSEVYGTAVYTPIDEKHPLQGQSPYSASKIAADMTAMSYAYSFNLPFVILRPFNTYGPRQSSRAIIPTIISQALTEKQINIGSPSPLRDFNYVSDTVNGFIFLAESNYNHGEVFNLSSGKQISIGELAELIKKILNVDIPVICKTERIRPEKSEVLSLLGDSSYLRENTPWKSETSLEDGIDKTIRYVRKYINNYKTERYII